MQTSWVHRIFSDYFADVVSDIIRNCEFRVLDRDSVIIKQGEKGDWLVSTMEACKCKNVGHFYQHVPMIISNDNFTFVCPIPKLHF